METFLSILYSQLLSNPKIKEIKFQLASTGTCLTGTMLYRLGCENSFTDLITLSDFPLNENVYFVSEMSNLIFRTIVHILVDADVIIDITFRLGTFRSFFRTAG